MLLGLLAILFALDIFSPQATPGVSAHECQSPTDDHTDNTGDDACTADLGDNAGDHAGGDHVRPTFSGDDYNSEDNYYEFSIMENRDGSTNAITLGQVMATLPGGGDVTLSFNAGTDPDDFITFPSGHVQYDGTGLDFEAASGLTDDGDRKYLTATFGVTAIKAGDADPGLADRTATAMIRIYVEDQDAGPPSAPMGVPVMPRAADDTAAPPITEITAASAAKMMTVSWVKPDGLLANGTHSTYTVQYREEGQTEEDDWVTVSPTIGDGSAAADTMTTLSGLKEKANYEVRVKVSDSDSDDNNSEWSAAGMGETASVPDKVEVAVSSEDLDSGELMVSWTNADGTMHDGGGDSKAKYKVEYGERGSFDPTQDHTLRSYETAGSSAIIQGLDNGTLYHVRVRAMNRVGMADYSDSASATPYGEPSAPRNLQVLGVNHNTLLARWEAPSDMGGYDSVSYKVTHEKVGDASTATTIEDVGSTSAVISGLEADTSYWVQVKAANARGDSPAIINFGRTTMGPADATVPGVVRNLSVSPISDTHLFVSWNAPASDGGAAITGYSVQYRESGATNWTIVTRAGTDVGQAITGLTAGTSYEVRVAAMNSAGTGSYAQATARTLGTSPPTVPGMVQNLSVSSVSQSELSVSWNAPASDGGAAITGYSVQYRESGATNWTIVTRAGTDVGQAITGLTAGTSYEVRVAAMNSEGTGSYAQATARTLGASPPTVPGMVQNLSVSPVSQSELSVSWNAPASDGGAAITGYSVQYRESGATNWTIVTRAGTDVGQAITGLTAGTSYEVRVAAMNSEGTGSYAQATAQTMAAPVPPADPCLGNLPGDMGISGQWASGCDSIDRAGSHARFYTFTLTQESEVTITLESADADAYLFLRAREAKSGTVLNDHVDDDDAGVGTNSEIRESLAGGTYTIEATTYYAGETGSFTLTLASVGTTTPPADPCLEKLTGDMSISGQWASGCDSMDRVGRHARFYTFTLSQESEVTIILESDDADTFLYLREGAKAKVGAALHENDDHEGSLSKSQIRETLAAGSYTIEATTYYAAETGSFTLTLSGSESTSPPADSCLENLASDMSVSGHWASGCESVERDGSHARFYTFMLAQESEVTITLESPDADAYLYLREGDGKSGTALNDHLNDDDAGEGTNSQIKESLPAGTYTIEATTYEAGETGSFTLTVTGL